MVIDRLNGGAGEEPHGLAIGHTRNQEADACTGSVQKEAFDGVIVKSAESVGDIEAVVTGVERHCKCVRDVINQALDKWGLIQLTIEPAIQVHSPVQKVLPSIDDGDGKQELKGRNKVPVDEASH